MFIVSYETLSKLLLISTFATCLYFSDLSKATAEQLNLTVEMMRFLSWLVTHRPTVLGGSQWDFLLCSMLAWLEVRWKSYFLCCDFEVRIPGLATEQCLQELVRISVSRIVKHMGCLLLDSLTHYASLLPPNKKIFWLKYDFFPDILVIHF